VPWVRLDEEFARHPKVLAAGPLGMAMQVAALCYCNSYLTDGFVPRSVVAGLLDLEGLGMRLWSGELIGGGEDADWKLIVSDLLDAGLWEEVPGGYRIHDFHDYQPTKREVLELREKRKAAGQKGGLASAQARAEASAPANTQAKLKPVPVPVVSGSTSSSVTEVDARDAAALAPLKHSLESVRLVVRWDKLGKYQRARVAELVATHGIPALVAAAQRAWQPNDPPAYANAWLKHWEALPPPLRVVAEKCEIHQTEKPCRGCAADEKAGTA